MRTNLSSYIYPSLQTFTLSKMKFTYIHTHTHTHTYIYIYYEKVRKDVMVQIINVTSRTLPIQIESFYHEKLKIFSPLGLNERDF